MIGIQEKKCCMCWSCVQACPKQCIDIITNNEGFDYPVINKEKCIQCGMCEKVCPVLNKAYNSNKEISSETYVGFIKDEDIRKKSSSGGLFSILAEQVLVGGGVVFGAAFDDKFLVHHVEIDDVNKLEKIRGSKYLQSRVENTFIEAKKILDSGKKVLFSGTACQISGLKAFLHKDYENLFTIDVLCHGTPSPGVWRKYLDGKEKEYGSSIQKVFFRSKKTGWKSYSIIIEFSNGEVYEKIATQDEFMKLFLENICLRPSCHECYFKKSRFSDITLGDCWGVEKIIPAMDDNKGTSIILINTKKGKRFFRESEQNLNVVKAELNKVLPPTADSRKSVLPHAKRKKFFILLNKGWSINKLQFLVKQSFIKRKVMKYKRLLNKVYSLLYNNR